MRIAVPNKGSLAEGARQILQEAGYRQRSETRPDLPDPENGIEFFYLRPRDIATYVGSGDLHLGITGRDLLVDTDGRRRGAAGPRFGRATFRFAARPGTVIRRTRPARPRRAAPDRYRVPRGGHRLPRPSTGSRQR